MTEPYRLKAAFDEIEKHEKRWPTPATIRQYMPSNLAIHRIAPISNRIEHEKPIDPTISEAARKAIADCAAKLRVDLQ